jgi:kinesin family protein 5
MGSPQKDVYDRVGKPVVEDIFKGYNGTIFVYGQTGSGKTYCI